MTRKEVSWRVRAAARTATARIAVRLHPPGWRRSDIRGVLSSELVDARVSEAIASGQWDVVHDRIAERICARPSRFALDPSSRTALGDAIRGRWPSAAAAAAERADAILSGRYDLLAYRSLIFTRSDGTVDWHFDPVHQAHAPLRFWADVPYLDPASGDHKIIWELNRHQHWLKLGRALWLTGDARYGQRMIDELEGWLTANPPLVGINWASMLELGFRSMSWIWGLHFLLGANVDRGAGRRADRDGPRRAWLVDMLVALDRQLTHVEQNLSIYFSPNTHLTGEALALYVAGVALPELAGSRRWREIGRGILLQEIDKQIGRDGGHAERSMHYHRYTLDFYMMALLTARRDQDPDAERRFADATTRLAEFARTLADADGRLPLIGDDDGGMLWPLASRECPDIRDSLAVAAVLLDRPDLAPWGLQEEACWIVGPAATLRDWPKPSAAAAPSRVFPDTGYLVLRDDAGSHAVFDVGPHGYMNGGHAHADALSLTLSIGGRSLLVDRGTATYTMNPALRDRFRGSASHNTLTVDDQPQARPAGPFHWQTRANATLHNWRGRPRLDWAEASHDGYAPLRHRRSVLRTTNSGWLIVDEVLGSDAHAAAAHWHVDPQWTLRAEGAGRVRATHADGSSAWIVCDADDLSLAYGDETTGLGWFAPAYGAVVPAWTARMTRAGHAPFGMITWIGAAQNDSGVGPSIERVNAACAAGDVAVAAYVRNAGHTSIFVVCPSSAAAPHGCACDLGDYQTDARVFHGVEEGGALTQIDLIDGTQVVARRRGGISVCSSTAMADLQVTWKDGVLDLEASEPPAQLRIESDPLNRPVAIRLNRRERPLPADAAGSLLVYGSDWSVPVRDLLNSPA
jgi:hypothetical protein